MRRWIIGAIPISLWVSWAAWRGPPPPKSHTVPAPFERLASHKDRQTVLEMASTFTVAIQQAMATRGHPIETAQLEAADAQGKPYVQQAVPDNPLMPNIASVAEHCPPHQQMSTADWVYCPEMGVIVPVVQGQSLKGKE